MRFTTLDLCVILASALLLAEIIVSLVKHKNDIRPGLRIGGWALCGLVIILTLFLICMKPQAIRNAQGTYNVSGQKCTVYTDGISYTYIVDQITGTVSKDGVVINMTPDEFYEHLNELGFTEQK